MCRNVHRNIARRNEFEGTVKKQVSQEHYRWGINKIASDSTAEIRCILQVTGPISHCYEAHWGHSALSGGLKHVGIFME